MAKNRGKAHGLHIALPVPEGTKSGEPVLVNGYLPGVALTDRGDGGNIETEATVWRDGTWILDVDGAVTDKGTRVFIVPATRALTTTATGNTLFGYALETKAAPVAPIEVVLAQV